MKHLALLLLLVPSIAYAEPAVDAGKPRGLFACRSKEGTFHHLRLSDLGFVAPECPAAPAILVTDEGAIEFGLPFAEVARRLGMPTSPPTTLRKNLGTEELPATFVFRFDERHRLYSVERGVADHVADQLAAYWGPSLPLLGRLPTRVWFNPRGKVRASLADRAMDLAADPRERGRYDGHRYVLELRTYTPVRDLFGPGGVVQRDLLGRTVEQIEAEFPELSTRWGEVVDGDVVTRVPQFTLAQTELDHDETALDVDLVDGKVTRARWRFGLGDAETLSETLAEIHRALGGALVSAEAPRPEQLVITYRLPTGTHLVLSSQVEQLAFGENQEVSGAGALWMVELRRP